jgi:hypothetical protein
MDGVILIVIGIPRMQTTWKRKVGISISFPVAKGQHK